MRIKDILKEKEQMEQDVREVGRGISGKNKYPGNYRFPIVKKDKKK